MGKNLNEIAQELKICKKIQIIYAFNGTGKTRLSKEFNNLISPKNEEENEELKDKKILYYNAFTEDLFYWDNDLENESNIKLCIQPNSFTDWIFNEEGLDQEVISTFQRYTNRNLMPEFNSDFSEVTFSFKRGNDEVNNNIKISKGEESCFIWSIFYIFMKQVITNENNKYKYLEYIFIDDPVTSLDENHLIELAVDLAETIRKNGAHLNFIITTHNIVFYNVLANELKNSKIYLLNKNEDGTYELEEKKGGANKSFAYHHHLIHILEKAIAKNQIEKYHFNLLRNLYEKFSNFLGYSEWKDLLPDEKEAYAKRIMHFYSHRSLLNDEIKEPTVQEKQMVRYLLNHLLENYNFRKE